MARYRDEREGERNFYDRNDRFGRERPWNYSYEDTQRRFAGGRFGERANYERDEPRYKGYSGYGDQDFDRGYERDYAGQRMGMARSRLRCRDIMTRDLAVATRDTTLVEIALMMKEEDTGVIPVVEYQVEGGNGGDGVTDRNRRPMGNGYSYGKLVGLMTDRDIVLRAVAEDKDPRTTRAEEIVSTDLYTARPSDRVVDVLRKMGDKQVRRIPIVSENGYLRGMISLGDIALEMEGDPELAEALEEISQKSSFWSSIFS